MDDKTTMSELRNAAFHGIHKLRHRRGGFACFGILHVLLSEWRIHKSEPKSRRNDREFGRKHERRPRHARRPSNSTCEQRYSLIEALAVRI